MVIVDGYNVIYSHEGLQTTAQFSLEKAREELMDILSNYVSFTKTELVLVFDAYLVKEGEGSEFIHDGYKVVYTKADQTAEVSEATDDTEKIEVSEQDNSEEPAKVEDIPESSDEKAAEPVNIEEQIEDNAESCAVEEPAEACEVEEKQTEGEEEAE
jgi:predicted RNA-binding protein with PIN domain